MKNDQAIESRRGRAQDGDFQDEICDGHTEDSKTNCTEQYAWSNSHTEKRWRLRKIIWRLKSAKEGTEGNNWC